MVQVVLPNDANPLGNILGGRVMHWIDMVGAVVAFRHSRRPVVTASMEHIDFHSPIRVGQIVQLKGCLHYVGRSSMQVGVEVYAENPMTGQKTHTSSAIVTYVALDDHGKPTPAPKLLLETDDEKKRFQIGQERQRRRIHTAE
jgi:acyl-CoA hydrolase